MNKITLDSQPDTAATLGVRHAYHYKLIADGLFPPPIKIGRKSVWPSNETQAIVRARIAGKSDDEIRALVCDLVSARANALQAA